MRETIPVTGATGLLGGVTAARLDGTYNVIRTGRRVPDKRDGEHWVRMDVLDTTCVRELLGWEPKRNLDDTLPAMVQNLLDDPQRWYLENDLDIRTIPRKAPHDVAASAA